MQSLLDEIHYLDLNQLKILTDAIERRKIFLSKLNLKSINLGDLVQFKNNNRTVQGNVSKVNRKTIEVIENLSSSRKIKWRIHASLVSKV